MGCSASLPTKETAPYDSMSKRTPRKENEDDLEAVSHNEMEKEELSTNTENVMGRFCAKMNRINKGQTHDIVFSKDEIVEVLNETICKLENQSEDDLGENLRVILQTFTAFSRIFRPVPYDVVQNHQRDAGRLLAENKIVTKLCNLIKERLGKDINEGNIDKQHSNVIIQALNILLNSSCYTKEVTQNIASHSEFLKTLKDFLEFHIPGRIQEEDEETIDLVMSILGIIHNTIMVEENIPHIKSLEIVDILCSYLESKHAVIRLDALAILATVIDEKESETLQKKPDAIELLQKILETALKNPSHECTIDRTITWYAKDCAFTVRRLARNDVNTKLLVEKGFLPDLAKLVKTGTADEQKEGIGAIWSLAFDEKNQKKIIKHDNPNVVKTIFRLRRKSDNEEVKKTADGCLRTLLDQLKKHKKYKRRANFYKKKESEKLGEKGHIMISYNRTHREDLVRIRDELKAKGYRVWMDIDEMKGSTLDAMYEAVQSAHIVLMCMSQGYKDSENCRLEAINAWKKKKHIVPLLMQTDYKADGWLDMILEAKTFYDFSGKYPFEEKFADMLEEIKDLYGKDSSCVPNSSMTPVRKWTQHDVTIWINQHSVPMKLFRNLKGRDLSALVTMKKVAPECFYSWLQKNLKLNSLSTIDMFMEALSDIKE